MARVSPLGGPAAKGYSELKKILEVFENMQRLEHKEEVTYILQRKNGPTYRAGTNPSQAFRVYLDWAERYGVANVSVEKETRTLLRETISSDELRELHISEIAR